MAEVFVSRDRRGRRVALKRLRSRFHNSATMCELFEREARIGTLLRHPNLVPVLDTEYLTSHRCFTMELIEGMNLRWLVVGALRRGARLTLGHATRIVMDAAAGLHHAHEATDTDGTPLHLVHRDLSPTNILIGFDGSVRVADFGVAQIGRSVPQRDAAGRAVITGKLSYMSPEQAQGKALDRTSDVFGLGILLYEATTSMRLFGCASSEEIQRAIARRDPPRPSERVPGYPRKLEAIVMRALSRHAEDRFATALDLQRALERFARQHKLDTSRESLRTWMENVFDFEHSRAKARPRLARGTGSNTIPKADVATDPDRILSQAKDWLDHGEYDRAMAAFALVLCRQPRSRKALAGYELCRGSRALQAGDRTTAGACFRRAWEVDLSNMAMARFVLAFEREQAQRMGLTT